MKLLDSQKINKEIKEDFFYSFETNEGIYLIEVIAKAKSWWQNLKSLKSFFKDDDIILYLDNTEIFTSNSQDSDVRSIWNGNEQKGLSKTVLVAMYLTKGGHTLRFKPDQSPSLESINIMELEETDNNTLVYFLVVNNPPEKGDRRPWINYVLQNLAIREFSISASTDKYGRDDDDIKIIIDGKVEKNESKNSHQDWYWCGKILKGSEAILKKEVNLQKGKHTIELYADGSPNLNKIEVVIVSDNNNGSEYHEGMIKPYVYKGVLGNEDYNRYDSMIAEVVSYWNNEFLKDINPPSEPLDPNLVKAMIYQESRVGYYKGVAKNIMQVGNEGDPSLKTLRGELKEYWIHDGEVILLKYDAKIETVKDSIHWGVRWLYHKAQGTTNDNNRYWVSWKEAVGRYGPPKAGYVNSIWGIYKKGIKKEKNSTIQLWLVFLLTLTSLLFFGKTEAYSLKDRVKKDEMNTNRHEILEDVEIAYNSAGSNYFLAQIEWEKDWWEDLKVGRNINHNIRWLAIDKPPGEQAILSAKFFDLIGFDNPLVEVYGLTHAGHGYLYIYEIKNNALNLLFETEAVDFNPDIRWAPDNFKKYGYANCGEIFSDGKLASEYKDINNDDNPDLVLSGVKEIICDKEGDYLKNSREVKATSVQIERSFFWDINKHTWVDTATDTSNK